MLDIYEEFEKRNNKNSYESEVKDLLSWLWENLDDSKLDNESLGNRDNFNLFLESENINVCDVVEEIEKRKNTIVKDNGWITTTAAENYIDDLLKKAFFAGVEAAENEVNQRISKYNETMERMKKEIEDFHDFGAYTSSADLMQALYSDIDNMNLFKENKLYYIIQSRSKYTSEYLEQGKKAYTKKEVNSIVRKMKKEFYAVRVLEIKNGKETVINEYIKEAA